MRYAVCGIVGTVGAILVLRYWSMVCWLDGLDCWVASFFEFLGFWGRGEGGLWKIYLAFLEKGFENTAIFEIRERCNCSVLWISERCYCRRENNYIYDMNDNLT